MAAIIKEIVWVERRVSTVDKVYYRTYAVLESGQECIGYGRAFRAGDRVMYFYDERHDICKMIKLA